MAKKILFVILLLAGFLRLWHIGDYMTFLGDEGRDVLAVRQIILGKKIALIGPGTSVGNMYLGPLYYYLMVPSLWLAGFSPVGSAVMVALFSLATIVLLYIWGEQLFSKATTLAICLLYAISPAVITYSHSSWNPNVMPFFALVSMYGMWQVWRFGKVKWLPVVGVSLAFVLNSHYLGLLLFPPVALFWFLSRRQPLFRKYSFIALGLFAFLMSPLLIFDLRHNWQNTKSIVHFFTDRQQTVNFKIYKALPNLWPVWQDIVASLLAAKNILVGQILSWLILSALAFKLAIQKSKSKNLLFLLVWLFTGLIGLGLYKQHIYVHYYGFLFPVLFLVLGFMPRLKIINALILVGLCYLSLSQTPILFSPNRQMERTAAVSKFIQDKSGGQPFNLALVAEHNYDAAYRYFLDVNSAPYYTIHQKIADQLFVICEEKCEPIGHPLWEIASFGWAKVDERWDFPWGVTLYKLVHNPTGQKA